MVEQPKVNALYRYPVKGLSPEPLKKTELRPGETIAFDRIYAIENGSGRFDPDAPKYLPKINFLMLMRNERLAALKTDFEKDTHTLTIHRNGNQVAKGTLNSRIGCQMIEQFFAAYLKDELRGPPKIVHSDGHSFSDVAAKCVHIINLATVRDIERSVGKPINPLRFRANIYIEGLPPWREFEWLDKEIKIGDTKLDVFDRTERCEATNVEPEKGTRDMAIPATLLRMFGHNQVGIYAKVTSGGVISEDTILCEPA